MTTAELLNVLREARESIRDLLAEYEAKTLKAKFIETERELLDRVDAALAERQDSATDNLEWQSDISPKSMTWQEAKDYAASLGDGWRLPTRTELLTLVDDTKHNPACSVFPDCPSDWFWTSTPWAGSSSGAWLVYFSYGDANFYDVSDYGRVRCVR